MDDKLIEKAVEYVKELFQNDYSGHDAEHSIRVYRLAMTLSSKRNDVNQEIVALSSLLHDVDDIKLFPDHHQYENARGFLNENNVDTNTQEEIILNIQSVSFKGSDSVVPSTIEGKIVQDADRLDAIGAIGIARAFAFGGSHNRPLYVPNETYQLTMNEKEYRSHKGSTIAHFYEKLLKLKDMLNTEEAKEIAKHRQQYMEDFLQEFFAEVNGER